MTGQAPDAAMIEALARAALARIPEPFQHHLADIVLMVEDFADDETLDAMGIEDPFDLTG
ncbi:neutral zinc metallopeptidase, partial [Escherichia coli]|nr:neutral zinc metallopeptidase [Escherichia coli]